MFDNIDNENAPILEAPFEIPLPLAPPESSGGGHAGMSDDSD
jgi:hypothetical protein